MLDAILRHASDAQDLGHGWSRAVCTRCQFSDANKMAVGDAEVWQPITIYNNEDQPIKCMATQLEATDFKVEFSADAKNVNVFQ